MSEMDKGNDVRSEVAGWVSPVVWRVTVLAGVFSFVVMVFLWVDYQRHSKDQLIESRQMLQWKKQLLEKPEDTELIEQVRSYDQMIRQRFLRHRGFLETGRYLLGGGVSVFVLGVGLIVSGRKRLWARPGREDRQAGVLRESRLAVCGLSLLMVLLVFWAAVYSRLGKPINANSFQSSMSDMEKLFPSWAEIQEQWPRFRGPGGGGICRLGNVPMAWDEPAGQSILWKTAIPLSGNSSPIVWGDRVFLTGADEENRRVYCLDSRTGGILWTGAFSSIPRRSNEPPEVEQETGYAASTPATDGRRVYAIFANGDVGCFDYEGQRVWAMNLGLPDSMYGYATSLVVFEELVLVQYDQGSYDDGLSMLFGIDVLTGRVRWQKARSVSNSWATPVIVDPAGNPQLVTCADPWVISYDPRSGEEIWKAKCVSGDVAPSPVYSQGRVFVTTPDSKVRTVKTEGRGDVTETHVGISFDEGVPNITSPLATEKYLFVTTFGTITCFELDRGEVLWEKQTDLVFEASPCLVGDRVYFSATDGTTLILACANTYQELGRAVLSEGIHASPAFSEGKIYLRTEGHLYCIGSQE